MGRQYMPWLTLAGSFNLQSPCLDRLDRGPATPLPVECNDQSVWRKKMCHDKAGSGVMSQ